MTLFASITFGIALLGVVALFGLKYWEERTQRVVAPGFRLWSDDKAIELKRFLIRCRMEADKFGPIALRFLRILVHKFALAFAAFARTLEGQAHRLADRVSHKHRFERREPKNEFLKQVSEYKNGVDTER